MPGKVVKPPLAVVIPLTIAVLAVAGIALGRGFFSPSHSTPQLGEAPDFTLPAMAGANITLSDLQGTAIVLNFWSISCPWCRTQLPYLENVAQRGEGEIKVIAINIADNAASLRRFFADYEPAMTIALDENREVFASYCQNYNNLRGYIPFTLLIDGQRMVKYARTGAFASEAELRDTIEDVLGITIP